MKHVIKETIYISSGKRKKYGNKDVKCLLMTGENRKIAVFMNEAKGNLGENGKCVDQ